MVINYASRTDSEGFLHDQITVLDSEDNSVYSNYADPLYDCPEDAILERDMISCGSILQAMKLAYNAGKNGETLTINKTEMEEE